MSRLLQQSFKSAQVRWYLQNHHQQTSLSLPVTQPVSHFPLSQSLTRCIATKPPPPPQKKGFVSSLVENIRQDMARNKEMKESLAQFRKEAQKLEETDALKKAREKFESIEKETGRGLDSVKEKLEKTFEEAQKTEFAKKSREVTDELTKQARAAGEALGKATEKIGEAQAFKTIGKGVDMVKSEVNVDDGIYRPPAKLRKRKEISEGSFEERIVQPNEEATGIELHKDSKWSQSWAAFRDNNPYVNKVMDWKTKFDESDHSIVRVARAFTDKVSDLLGGMFEKNEMSAVLTEICKMDPSFDRIQFLRDCEKDIIPNILEATARGDIEILKDWCHEAVFNVISTPIKEAFAKGYRLENKILDITNIDIAFGKMMDQGPVLVVTFQSQQIFVVKDPKGNIVEGDPDKIMRVNYVWVLCRDQAEVDPKAAWRLLEMAASAGEQFL